MSLAVEEKPLTLFEIGKYYRVTNKQLGEGSFSKVYRAEHKAFRHQVALKIIDKDKIKENYIRKNLYREARILKRLNHSNIVNFYEEIELESLYCLSLEYVRGPNLSQFLKNHPGNKIAENVAKPLFHQMLSAVFHMHSRNIIHRDLKQENILIENQRIVKIVDFGLSNVYYPNYIQRTHCGSVIYAAPELFEGKSTYGREVDLWSLGVVAYSMLVGKMPFYIRQTEQLHARAKEFFLRRIRRGLIQENWLQMGHLTYECCCMIEGLLRPNQFQRLTSHKALLHEWFQRDRNFRTSLPEKRVELDIGTKSEILEFMSSKLRVPKWIIEIQISDAIYCGTLSAIFHIAQDTILKEVSYPLHSRNVRDTFAYRLGHFIRSRAAKREFNRKVNDKLLAKGIISSGNSADLLAKRIISSGNSADLLAKRITSSGNSADLLAKGVISSGNSADLSAISVRVGDGPDLTTVDKATEAPSFVNIKKSPVTVGDGSTRTAYRSYKNSRPVKVVVEKKPAEKLFRPAFTTTVSENKFSVHQRMQPNALVERYMKKCAADYAQRYNAVQETNFDSKAHDNETLGFRNRSTKIQGRHENMGKQDYTHGLTEIVRQKATNKHQNLESGVLYMPLIKKEMLPTKNVLKSKIPINAFKNVASGDFRQKQQFVAEHRSRQDGKAYKG